MPYLTDGGSSSLDIGTTAGGWMHSKTFVIVLSACIIGVLTVAVIVIFQAPVGFRMFHFHNVPADRRVAWVEPPGRFDPKGGRVTSATPPEVPGGFIDYARRTVNFRGLVTRIPPDGEAPGSIAFQKLREAGINLISVPVRWQILEPAPMDVSIDAILSIREFLDTAAANGMGVILVNTTPFSDMSECGWAADAPAWAYRVPTGRANAHAASCAKPSSRDIGSAGMFRVDFLDARWTPDEITLQDHLIRSWTKLAEVASRSPGLIGYALADSMRCPDGMESAACTEAWTGFIDRFANGVRAVDGSALFFLDTDSPDGLPSEGSVVLSEIVPGAADDSTRGPLKMLPSGSFTIDHKSVRPGPDFLEAVDAIERRGRSWLIEYPLPAPGQPPVSSGAIPDALELARPFPEAVAGRNVKYSFDRLFMPTGPDDVVYKPGTTDVFTLEFDDRGAPDGLADETSVWLPLDMLYMHPENQDAPAWTLDISDGSAVWQPGRHGVILWRTEEGNGPHRMKITPWGGRRLPTVPHHIPSAPLPVAPQ